MQAEQLKYDRGFSSYFSIGKSRKWGIIRDGPAFRFHIGRVSMGFVWADLEGLIKWVVDALGRVTEHEAEATKGIEEAKAKTAEAEAKEGACRKDLEGLKESEAKLKTELADVNLKVKGLMDLAEENGKKHIAEMEEVMKKAEETILNDERLKKALEKVTELQEEVDDHDSERLDLEEEIEKLKTALMAIKKTVGDLEE